MKELGFINANGRDNENKGNSIRRKYCAEIYTKALNEKILDQPIRPAVSYFDILELLITAFCVSRFMQKGFVGVSKNNS